MEVSNTGSPDFIGNKVGEVTGTKSLVKKTVATLDGNVGEKSGYIGGRPDKIRIIPREVASSVTP